MDYAAWAGEQRLGSVQRLGARQGQPPPALLPPIQSRRSLSNEETAQFLEGCAANADRVLSQGRSDLCQLDALEMLVERAEGRIAAALAPEPEPAADQAAPVVLLLPPPKRHRQEHEQEAERRGREAAAFAAAAQAAPAAEGVAAPLHDDAQQLTADFFGAAAGGEQQQQQQQQQRPIDNSILLATLWRGA